MLRDWTDSDPVNSLSVYGERFFVRLIMKADDYGCYHADARLLKSFLFPLLPDGVREADISRWLAESEKAGLIVLYESDGKRYLQIQDFRQRLDKARHKFPLPPAGNPITTVNEFPAEAEKETEEERKGSGPGQFLPAAKHMGLIPDMVYAFQKVFPDYPSDTENDYPSCMAIAKKIALAKGWTDVEMLQEKRQELLVEWEAIVLFASADDWYSKQSISMLNKKWQDLIQAKNRQKDTTPLIPKTGTDVADQIRKARQKHNS